MFLLATILDTVQRFVHAGGYYVIFGLLFCCGLGLPLPEDIPLILGGYFSATGHLDLAIVGVVSWLGIIGGDCMLYYFGHRYGLNITRVPFIGKHVTKERIVRAEQLFERWGIWVVGVGRLFAGIRGAMVIAAGTIRFNFIKFIIADSLAAIISGGLFIALGYWGGKKLGDLNALRHKISHYEHWVLIGIGLIVVGVIGYNLWRSRRHKPTLADVALTKVADKLPPHPAGDGSAGSNSHPQPPAQEYREPEDSGAMSRR
jgi:membrane protein DedA with SNARE-associated domain